MTGKTRLDIVRQSDWDTSSAKAEITTKHAELDAQDEAILASISDVVVDIAQNEADSDAAEASLETRLGVEEGARAAADATEEAARIAGDNSLDVKFVAEIAALQADVDGNESDADAAVASLSAELDLEESRATAAEASLASDISTEASTARAAEAVLTTAITDEVNARAAADAQAAIDNADARTTLQTTLEGQIETLRTESEDADDSIEVALNDAVSTLTANLDAEISATNADFAAINTDISGLTASLAAEVVAREEADEELDQKISDIISNTDISAMDGFNEVEDHLERLEDYHMSHLVLSPGSGVQVMDKDAIVPNSINFSPMGGGSYPYKVKVGTLQIVMNGQMLHQGVDFDTTGTDELVDMVNFNFDVESDDVFDFWAVIKPDAIEYTGGGY